MISSVRTVQSFGMRSSLVKRLDNDLLNGLQKLGAKRSVIRSLEQAAVYFACFLVNSVVFWYGGILVRQGADIGNILAAFVAYVTLLFALANVVPHITSMADAFVSLRKLRQQIERQPHIDTRGNVGIVRPPGSEWTPSYKLTNVTFGYPSRPTVPVLKDVSVSIDAGTVTAFCGASGSGKSTIAALLLREYDPETANLYNKDDENSKDKDDRAADRLNNSDQKTQTSKSSWDTEKAERTVQEEIVKGSGRIYFAGCDIRDYNVRWLRSQVSVVSQNPQLFTATVFENVAAGLTGTDLQYRPDIDGAPDAPPEIKNRTAKIRELCCEAMRKAQAWQFVSEMPQGIDTMIAGGRTGVLSGGQRQRLAIARALVKKPSCLLLDEATSALDAKTEEEIRLTLEQELAERGMTTIIIAHRLSTISRADRIVVLKDGRLVDQGRYEDLMDEGRPDQTFRQLAMAQSLNSETTNDSESPSDPNSRGSNTSDSKLEKVTSSTAICGLTEGGPGRLCTTTPDRGQDGDEAISPGMGKHEHRESLSRFFMLLQSQKWFFAIGTLGGLMAGASFPVAQWMYGQAIDSLRDKDVLPSTDTWSMWLLVLAVVDLFVFL